MGFYHHAKIYKKTHDTIPQKCLDRWKDDWIKDKLYFIGPFWVALEIQKDKQTGEISQQPQTYRGPITRSCISFRHFHIVHIYYIKKMWHEMSMKVFLHNEKHFQFALKSTFCLFQVQRCWKSLRQSKYNVTKRIFVVCKTISFCYMKSLAKLINFNSSKDTSNKRNLKISGFNSSI